MSSDVMRGTGPFSIDPCPKIGNCDGPLTTPFTPPPPYLETGPVCGHLPPGGPGRTDFRLRLPTGAHTALAGKTRALADLGKTLGGPPPSARPPGAVFIPAFGCHPPRTRHSPVKPGRWPICGRLPRAAAVR